VRPRHGACGFDAAHSAWHCDAELSTATPTPTWRRWRRRPQRPCTLADAAPAITQFQGHTGFTVKRACRSTRSINAPIETVRNIYPNIHPLYTGFCLRYAGWPTTESSSPGVLCGGLVLVDSRTPSMRALRRPGAPRGGELVLQRVSEGESELANPFQAGPADFSLDRPFQPLQP